MFPFWEFKHTHVAPARHRHPLPFYPSQPLPPPSVQIHPQPQKPQRGGRPTSPRRPLRNHGRVWFRLEQGSHLFWAHLCWLTHVLTGKLAACSMGPGSTSAVGYQFLTCPASFWAPLQLTTSSNAPTATHSHPPTYSKQPSSALYFCRGFSVATYRPVFSVKLRKWHCFTLTFSWCVDGAEGLESFHCGCMSHVLGTSNVSQDSNHATADLS